MPGDPRPEGGRLLVRARVPGGDAGAPRLDVDLEIGAGVTAVTGPSGAGKTTLLTTVAGLVTPEAGRIVLDGVALFDGERGVSVPAHRRRVALVFQSLALFPHLSAWENVAYGLRRELRRQPRAARRAQALEWLERARVTHRADRLPASLSGGEAQRVALARALASEPRALLLDEPFSALDDDLRSGLGADLRALVHQLGVPALLVTHHREDAASLAARTLVLSHGRVVEGITFQVR
jgi:molybdate transport system ATP-binding protein